MAHVHTLLTFIHSIYKLVAWECVMTENKGSIIGLCIDLYHDLKLHNRNKAFTAKKSVIS